MKKRSFSVAGLSLTAVLLLSGCLTPTGSQKPAEVVYYGAKSGAGSSGIHTVLGGDTVYTVAQHYHLPLRDLITLNNLSPPYHLSPGYRLKLPPPNEYRVQAGDTLNNVSRLFNVSVSEIAKINNLSTPYNLNKGQTLRMPSPQPKLVEEFAQNPTPPSFASDIAAGTQTSVPVKVAGVEKEVLAPPPGAQGQTKSSAAAPVISSTAGYPPQPVAKTSQTLQAPAAQAPQVQKVAAIPQSIAPKIPPRTGSGKFMRPVDGKEISGYGPKEGGLHNDGINIKAPRGTAVRSADNGVVAYVGSEMQGYGNLILIRHADRWMTAYAHMDKMLVKKGDTVKAGQSIGTVGSSGQVDSPQLHFEVRRGTEALNPDLYL